MLLVPTISIDVNDPLQLGLVVYGFLVASVLVVALYVVDFGRPPRWWWGLAVSLVVPLWATANAELALGWAAAVAIGAAILGSVRR